MGIEPYIPGSFNQLEASAISSSDNSTHNATEPPLAFDSTVDPNSTFPPLTPTNACHICQLILYKDIAGSNVRYWDLCILVPNVLFLLFLAVGFRTAIAKLQRTSSPIFLAFYGLVILVAIISVLRCIVSMTVNASIKAADIADQALWLILRFFLLATELSVVIFGLAFGHLDSRTSIQRVLLVTFSLALVYSSTQKIITGLLAANYVMDCVELSGRRMVACTCRGCKGVLEFMFPDNRFHISTDDQNFDIFGHGGMQFWFASSVFFFVIYSVICILPFTKIRQRFALPTKRSFYWYCLLLAIMNLIQAVGSGLLHYDYMYGMCVVDGTTFIYFACFTPLVYFTFLREFFKSSLPPSILFSYKAHVDDEEEDNVNLPQQTHPGRNEMRDVNDYDTSNFDNQSPNPLYDIDTPGFNIRPQLTINTDYFDGPEDV